MAASFSKRQLWKRLVYGLILWQILILALSGVSAVSGYGNGAATLSAADQRILSSVLSPLETDLQASSLEISKLRGIHQSAVSVWQQAWKRLLASENEQLVLSWLAENAPQSPRYYDSYTRWVHSDFWRESREELLVTAAGYGCTDDSIRLELAGLEERNAAEKEKIQYLADAQILLLILRAEYTEAAKATKHNLRAFFDKQAEEIQRHLQQLETQPDSFELRLALGESLFGLARTGYLTVGYTTFCWKLWDDATTSEQQVAVKRLLARIYERDSDNDTARLLYIAAARQAARLPEAKTEGLPEILAGLAAVESELGQHLLAAHLFGEVASKTQDHRLWGSSVFNRGMLLHQSGYPGEAEQVLLTLLASNVNDKDPSGNLTETYQNYRNNAAALLAKTYQSRINFPMMYYWQRKAAKDYPFQSWCGTDMESNNWRENVDLVWGSFLCGPFFFAAALIISPIRYAFFLGGCLVLFGIIYWQRKQRSISL